MVFDVILYGIVRLIERAGGKILDEYEEWLARRFPWLERIGLVESPPEVVRREAQASTGNIRQDDEDG